MIGQFRDLDDPNRFVWLSVAFAICAMVDFDNVLLLRPARSSSGFAVGNTKRPPPGAKEIPGSLVVATIYYLDKPADNGFVDHFEDTVKPTLDAQIPLLVKFEFRRRNRGLITIE
jgi:hypothetical protein